MNEIRKEEQRTFYNRWRTGGREIAPNMKYYSIVDSREKFLANWFIRNATKKRVLDYGCGSGGSARKIAECGAAEVVGVDISEDSITNARKEIETTDLRDRCRFFVMDAENMTFEKNRFDIVYACGPEPMMRRIFEIAESRALEVQACFERIIRCSIGLCGSCVIGEYRVCTDGPVFTSQQLEKMKGEFGFSKRDRYGRKIELD